MKSKVNKNLIVIRLLRCGHKHYPVYEIVVTFRFKSRNGSYIEKLGFINPNNKERILFLDFARLGFWLNRGVIMHLNFKKYISKIVKI